MARSWQFTTVDSWREPFQSRHGLNLLEVLMAADLPDEEPVPIPANPPYQPVHRQDDPHPQNPRTDPTSSMETPFPQAFPDTWQA